MNSTGRLIAAAALLAWIANWQQEVRWLPMILGLGCDTMATMTTRILDTRKERLQVTLLLALKP